MKVLFFDPYFQGNYGNARYVVDLFRHEELIGTEFFTCSPDVPTYLDNIEKPDRFLLLKNEEVSSLQQFGGAISNSSLIDKFRVFKDAILYSFKFRKLCKKESIDIVHCNSIRAILTIGLGAKLSSSKLVLYIKSNLVGYVFCFPAFFLADKILFQTETNKQKVPKSLLLLFKSKFRILKNAIDIDRVNKVLNLQDLPKSKKLINQSMNLVFIGSVVERKGLKFLLEALNKIKKDGLDVSLYIIGDHTLDAKYSEELDELIVSYQLQDKIFFLGHKDEPLYYLHEMDFLVLPSLDEGVPKSVIESICMGIPVIAADVGGTREVILNNKNGFIVRPGHVDDLYSAIKLCFERGDMVKKFARSEAESARKEFSFSTHSENLSIIYKELST